MAEQRLTRKDIKEPDQFISTSIRFAHWFGAYKRYVIYGTLVIVFLIGLMFAWSSWHQGREHQAVVYFYEAKKLLDVSGRPGEATERVRAKEQLENLVRDYGHTSVATTAYWYLGQLAFEARDYAKAIELYQHAQRKLSSKTNTAMFAAVTLGLAYAQEANGMCNYAVTGFDTVLQSSAYWLLSEAYLGLGRCFKQTEEQMRISELLNRLHADQNLSEATRQSLSEQLKFLQRIAAKRAD